MPHSRGVPKKRGSRSDLKGVGCAGGQPTDGGVSAKDIFRRVTPCSTAKLHKSDACGGAKPMPQAKVLSLLQRLPYTSLDTDEHFWRSLFAQPRREHEITTPAFVSLCESQPENFALVQVLAIEQLHMFVGEMHAALADCKEKGRSQRALSQELDAVVSRSKNTVDNALAIIEKGFVAGARVDPRVLDDMLLQNKSQALSLDTLECDLGGSVPTPSFVTSTFRCIGGEPLVTTLAFVLLRTLLHLLQCPGLTVPLHRAAARYTAQGEFVTVHEECSQSVSEKRSGGCDVGSVERAVMWRSDDPMCFVENRTRVLRVCMTTMVPPCVFQGDDGPTSPHARDTGPSQSALYRLWTEGDLACDEHLPHRATLFLSLLNSISGGVSTSHSVAGPSLGAARVRNGNHERDVHLEACMHTLLLLLQHSRFFTGLECLGSALRRVFPTRVRDTGALSPREVCRKDFFWELLRQFGKLPPREVQYVLHGVVSRLMVPVERHHAEHTASLSLWGRMLAFGTTPPPKSTPLAPELLLILALLAEGSQDARLMLTSDDWASQVIRAVLFYIGEGLEPAEHSTPHSSATAPQRTSRHGTVLVSAGLSLLLALTGEATLGMALSAPAPWASALPPSVMPGATQQHTCLDATCLSLLAVLRSNATVAAHSMTLQCLRNLTPFLCSTSLLHNGLLALLDAFAGDTSVSMHAEALLDVLHYAMVFSSDRGVGLLAHLMGDRATTTMQRMGEAAGTQADAVQPLLSLVISLREVYTARHSQPLHAHAFNDPAAVARWLATYCAVEPCDSADLLSKFFARIPPFSPTGVAQPLHYESSDSCAWRLILDPSYQPLPRATY